jgi:hypothetical protein
LNSARTASTFAASGFRDFVVGVCASITGPFPVC